MIYFDNSASAFYKPPGVLNAVKNTMQFLPANPGRAGHAPALKAGRLIYAARERAAAFFGFTEVNRTLFTAGCTDALNLAIIGGVTRGGHVITGATEHNSVLRPLTMLQQSGAVTLTVLPPGADGSVEPAALKKALTAKTCMVALTQVSNVTGAVTPLDEIGYVLKNHPALLLVDGAQGAGYLPLSLSESRIDLYAVAPHKGLHAPQGVGLLLCGRRAELSPIRYGGTGTVSHELIQPSDYPEGFEAGTAPTPAIAGLLAGLAWTKKNFDNTRQTLFGLGGMLRSGLKSLKHVTLYSPPAALPGIAAINIDGYDSGEVADILSGQYDICVRSGMHCAPLCHRHYGTEKRGMVRISLGCDNTPEQVTYLLKALTEIR